MYEKPIVEVIELNSGDVVCLSNKYDNTTETESGF